MVQKCIDRQCGVTEKYAHIHNGLHNRCSQKQTQRQNIKHIQRKILTVVTPRYGGLCKQEHTHFKNSPIEKVREATELPHRPNTINLMYCHHLLIALNMKDSRQ